MRTYGAHVKLEGGIFNMDEKENDMIVIEYDVLRNMRYKLETAREFISDTDPWTTERDELDDNLCITLAEFNRWKQKLIKILGVVVDE